MATRSSAIGILLVLVLCAPAAAEEAPRLEPRNLELLPLSELERKELARDNPDIAGRVQHLAGRLGKLQRHLSGRANAEDDGARKLRSQITATEGELAPFMARVVEACREHELTDALLRHMAEAPEGPLRAARYAQSLVLFVLPQDSDVRQLMETVVPATEGALLALDGQKEPLRKTLAQAGVSDRDIELTVSALDQRIRGIEKRFWRLVDYVVPEAERAAIHRVLPTAYQQHENILGHLYALPGLTASQGMRLRGLLTEIEAESAPDAALARRVRQGLQAKDLAADERARLRAESAEAENRLTVLQRYAVTTAKEILTAAHWTALEAIPPRVGLQDRRRTSPQILEGLQGYDRQKLAAMRAELASVRKAFQDKRRAAAAAGKDYGPDSPQMMGMQMAMANVEAEGNVIQRRFNGRIFRELLSASDVVTWVINPR